jgi:choline dehydrogenase-like flavoprotein
VYLASPPKNLTILTENIVTKVLFDESKKAIGVGTASGRTYTAAKEVILSAGAIDSPKTLLLSGIGPRMELSRLSIPVIKDLPELGKNLKDHPLFTTNLLLKPREKVGTQELVKAAPFDPLYNVGVQMSNGWLAPPAIYASKKFSALHEETKTHLLKVS